MKKLLSLLSILTISGTAIPTTIAANPYQKQENKLKNNDINYQQTNNLEVLNREKRDHKGNLKACAAGAGAFAATNGVATAVAPNPITGIVAAISGAIAAVCGIVENNIK